MSDEFNKDRVVEMEEDYDDGDSEDEGGDVQLGFIDSSTNNKLFHDNDWRNWDGGKVGGQPVWFDYSLRGRTSSGVLLMIPCMYYLFAHRCGLILLTFPHQAPCNARIVVTLCSFYCRCVQLFIYNPLLFCSE